MPEYDEQRDAADAGEPHDQDKIPPRNLMDLSMIPGRGEVGPDLGYEMMDGSYDPAKLFARTQYSRSGGDIARRQRIQAMRNAMVVWSIDLDQINWMGDVMAISEDRKGRGEAVDILAHQRSVMDARQAGGVASYMDRSNSNNGYNPDNSRSGQGGPKAPNS